MPMLKEAPEERQERILVVDDVMETTEVIQRNLEQEGYGVVVASSVDDAIRMLCMATFDLVITDMKMPGTSVLILLRYIRDNCNRTPIIIVSGYPMRDDEDEIERAGVREYITKPFTDEELLGAVRAVIENPEDLHSE